jgi:hypothetical protein
MPLSLGRSLEACGFCNIVFSNHKFFVWAAAPSPYLPGTPGGQPMTPGTGALDPTSPAIGMYISDLYEPWLSALFCIGGLVSAFFSFWRFLVHVSSSPLAYRTFFWNQSNISETKYSFCYCLLPS